MRSTWNRINDEKTFTEYKEVQEDKLLKNNEYIILQVQRFNKSEPSYIGHYQIMK